MTDYKTTEKSRINLELPRAMKLELKEIAKNQGETVATIIRCILRDKLNNDLTTQTETEKTL